MIGFRTLLHADWSASPAGRWVARADRHGAGWRVSAPTPVGPLDRFVSELWDAPAPLLAGFDFPLGLPDAYGVRTGLRDFPAALDAFGQGDWADAYAVAAMPAEVSVRRPFYPLGTAGRPRQRHLCEGLGVDGMDALRRRCERTPTVRRAASPLFWCVGATQVGKGSIVGWREVVNPARRRGAALWPFEGTLAVLAARGAPVLAESYPAEAYGHVGVRFGAGMSKRRAADRRRATAGLAVRCARDDVVLDDTAVAALADGFAGAGGRGDDAFDALLGLLGMIEVASGRRGESPAPAAMPGWEGWILGLGGATAACRSRPEPADDPHLTPPDLTT